jgi:hypothetical protein
MDNSIFLLSTCFFIMSFTRPSCFALHMTILTFTNAKNSTFLQLLCQWNDVIIKETNLSLVPGCKRVAFCSTNKTSISSVQFLGAVFAPKGILEATFSFKSIYRTSTVHSATLFLFSAAFAGSSQLPSR